MTNQDELNCFFGAQVEPGIEYKTIPKIGFLHVSQAALADASQSGRVTLYTTVKEKAFALGTLSAKDGSFHMPLDLNFMPDQEVRFSAKGDKVKVHITGYYEVDDNDDLDLDDDSFDEAEEEEVKNTISKPVVIPNTPKSQKSRPALEAEKPASALKSRDKSITGSAKKSTPGATPAHGSSDMKAQTPPPQPSKSGASTSTKSETIEKMDESLELSSTDEEDDLSKDTDESEDIDDKDDDDEDKIIGEDDDDDDDDDDDESDPSDEEQGKFNNNAQFHPKRPKFDPHARSNNQGTPRSEKRVSFQEGRGGGEEGGQKTQRFQNKPFQHNRNRPNQNSFQKRQGGGNPQEGGRYNDGFQRHNFRGGQGGGRGGFNRGGRGGGSFRGGRGHFRGRN